MTDKTILSRFKELIAESPYLHDGVYTWKGHDLHSGLSAGTIERQYNIIHTFLNKGEHMTVIQLKSNSHLYHIVVPGGGRFIIVASLKFKQHPTIKGFPNIMQVDSVSIEDAYGGRGIVTELYAWFAHQGHTLASDAAQFVPGKQLWKKFAGEAHRHGLKVHLFNGEEILKKNGKPVEYDGTNVPDSEIWSSGHDFSKSETVLISVK